MCNVSIIVPAYNAEAYIEETLKSILDQDYTDLEVIVVNDGSKDSTEKKVRGMAESDSRIKYLDQANSGGPAKPRNVGIEQAKGKYIFIFDADDVMLKGKISHSVELMEKYPAADLLFTNFSSIDENNKVIKENFLEEYDTLWKLIDNRCDDSHFISASVIHPALVKVNFIGTSSVVLRRSALMEADKFNESLKNSDDRLFWLRFSKSHNFIFTNRIFHQYRILKTGISNQSFTRRGPSKIKALEIARNEEINQELRERLSKQIAYDYASLAYAYRLLKDSSNQRLNAFQSLKNGFNVKALKLLFLGLTIDILRR